MNKEITKSNGIELLEKIYAPIGNEWVQKNSLVINYAKNTKLCLGGSIGISLARKRAIKVPGDLDFFTDSDSDANEFVRRIVEFMSTRTNTYYNIGFNHGTEFCLPGVKTHIRIRCPFWLPICVMVLKEPIKAYYRSGLRVQFFDDVVKAAKEATAIDGKPRTYDKFELDLSGLDRQRDVSTKLTT